MMLTLDALSCSSIHFVYYQQLSDIYIIDPYYLILNSIINEAELWQQVGIVTINTQQIDLMIGMWHKIC